MNEFRRTHRRPSSSSPQEAYIVAFKDHLTRLLRRSPLQCDIDDIVSREVLSVWADIDTKMRRFPNPSVYAFVRARGDRALIGFRRNDQAQRGQGARGGRTVLSLHDDATWRTDRPTAKNRADGDVVDRAGEFAGGLDAVADRLADDEMLFAALMTLPERQRKVLYLVDGEGYSVSAAADRLGVARETASRDRGAAHRALGTRPPC
jgi:RNA polymerase sigma factor (sigma-70 family)